MQMANTGWAPPSHLEPEERGVALRDFDLRMAARSEACVFLTGGEPAVQSAARRIHDLSAWRNGPFEVVSCDWPEAAVDALIARAFTELEPVGSREPCRVFEKVGTILVQEVWRVRPALQRRLADGLAWLRGARRPGFRRWRVMASSSRPVLPRVANGTFDDRLFYRLNVIHLVLPGHDTGDVDESPA